MNQTRITVALSGKNWTIHRGVHRIRSYAHLHQHETAACMFWARSDEKCAQAGSIALKNKGEEKMRKHACRLKEVQKCDETRRKEHRNEKLDGWKGKGTNTFKLARDLNTAEKRHLKSMRSKRCNCTGSVCEPVRMRTGSA